MNALLRNKRTFYYANISKTESPYDEYGNETSEQTITYSAPVAASGNISPARGTAELDQFGINTNYTKAIVVDNPAIPITKSSILWIDCVPDKDGEAGTIKHDYVVVQVAISEHYAVIAVKEVSVS